MKESVYKEAKKLMWLLFIHVVFVQINHKKLNVILNRRHFLKTLINQGKFEYEAK